MRLTREQLARITHAANRELRVQIGEEAGPTWDDADDHTRSSVIAGVNGVLDGDIVSPMRSHKEWLRYKAAQGWKKGPVKNVEKKTHPNMVTYDKLPEEQRAKDWVFFGIISVLKQITGAK